MCNCGKGYCTPSFIGKILLIVGGLNWGLIGVGMLMGSMGTWNVVNMLLGSMPILEAVVYVLVGVAAAVKIFGCKCKRCTVSCGSCGVDNKIEGNM